LDNKTIRNFEKNGVLDIEIIIATYNSYIYTIIKNSLSNKEDIEEILSDVFMVLWKNYEKIDKDIKIKPYLIGITKNLIRKKYRVLNETTITENIENYEYEINNNIDVQSLAEQNEKSKIISETIDGMKKEEQKIFIMFYYKSKKIKEISKELNASEAKIKITLHRLRKQMKKKLKERGYDYGK